MSYPAFWLVYLRAHRHPGTRMLHYVGTLLALACLVAGVTIDPWFLLASPVVGYGFAWTAHAMLEGNRPQTFGHPIWSLASDVRMLVLAVTGRLGSHLERCDMAPNGPEQARNGTIAPHERGPTLNNGR